MRKDQAESAVALTRFFFSLPSVKVLMLIALAIPVFAYGTLYLESALLHGEQHVIALTPYVIALLFPTVLIILLTKGLSPSSPLKQVLALGILTEALFALGLVAQHTLQFFLGQIYGDAVLLLSAGLSAGITYTITRYLFGKKWASLAIVIAELALYAVFLSIAGVSTYSVLATALKFIISSVLFFLLLVLLFAVINAPMKKNLGVGTVETAAGFARLWLYDEGELEDYMREVATKVTVPISVVALSKGNEKVLLISPSIHFGPFADLGGSDLPAKLKQLAVKAEWDCGVFHGAATHDLDPVEDVSAKLFTAVTENIGKAKWKKARELKIYKGVYGKAKAWVLDLGSCGICFLSRAPAVTEDINMGLGMALCATAEKKLKKPIALCDAHDSDAKIVTSFEPGSKEGHEYLMAIQNLRAVAKDKAICGWAQGSAEEGDIGDAGITVLAFGKKPSAVIVLLDGNGIEWKFRKKLEEEIKKRFGAEVVIIATTDTHSVNKVKGVVNPVCYSPGLVEKILSLVEKAMEKRREISVANAKFFFEYLALGPMQSTEIVSTVNSIVAMIKILIPVLLLWGGLTLYFILLLIEKVLRTK